MCGIIGFSTNSGVTDSELSILKKVMRESQIRGKHASGVAWYDSDGKIQSYVKPIPIGQLVEQFDFDLLKKHKNVRMIAHARYSTSDIKYNQPIVVGDTAIAHNGVITQERYELWEKLYNVKCTTKNDSELLLRALNGEVKVDLVDSGASIAAVVLRNGKLEYIRNGLRPLWCGKIGEGTVFASTYDILNRSGVKDIQKVLPKSGLEHQKRSSHNGKRTSYREC